MLYQWLYYVNYMDMYIKKKKIVAYQSTTVLLKCLFALAVLLLMGYLEGMYILSEVDYWHPTTVFY